MADSPREALAGALSSILSPEQLAKLVDEVLAIEKRADAEFSCKHCGRKQYQIVRVPDAKAVALALPDLLNQAYGRVGEANQQTDPVAFKRLTVTDTDEEVERALRAIEENRRRQRDERRQDGAGDPGSNGKGSLEAERHTDRESVDPGDDEKEVDA